MIKIAVVDDEQIMLEKICRIIDEQFIEEKMIRSFNNSMDFFNDADKFNFDLVFLDIDMPEMNGFELAENLKLIKPSITIIFISSHENLVFKSFDYNPYRFVRKSNLVTDLEEALSAYLNFYKSRSSQYMFSTFDGKKLMSISEIMYIEVYSHKLNIHTNNSMITANGNLKDIEHEFIKEGFIKTHQSFIVNYRFINFIKRTDVILDNGKKLPISRGKYEYVKEQYMKLSREM